MVTLYSSDSMFKKAFSLFKKDFLDNRDNVIIAILVIATLDLSLGTVCASKLLIGFPCPFCGLTRAGLELLTFDFVAAWNFNPLIYYVVALAFLWCLHRYFHLIPKWLLTILLIGLVLVSIPLYAYRFNAMFPNSEPMKYFENNILNIIINILNKGV